MATLQITYHSIPLFYIIESMNASFKVSGQDEDLNPKQEVCHEELVNHPTDFLKIMATAWDLYKVTGPKCACIFKGTPNLCGY